MPTKMGRGMAKLRQIKTGSGGEVGAKLRPRWIQDGPKLGQVEASWGQPGSKLEPRRGQVGPSWAKLGSSCA
eukprot:1772799-Karenia_brevis.AAC.1